VHDGDGRIKPTKASNGNIIEDLTRDFPAGSVPETTAPPSVTLQITGPRIDPDKFCTVCST